MAIRSACEKIPGSCPHTAHSLGGIHTHTHTHKQMVYYLAREQKCCGGVSQTFRDDV